MYVPQEQMPNVPLTLAIRTSIDPDHVAGSVRTTLQAVAPESPVTSMQSMAAILETVLGPQRFSTTLLGVFAAVAAVLAAAGLYGLIAYLVSRRTKEIGLRIALGASPRDVMQATAGRGIVLAAIGLTLGLAGALALTRLSSRVLFEISPADPLTYIAVALAFLMVTGTASYLPARRALRINPIQALRAE
jgi:putative ABC transport system permease protein